MRKRIALAFSILVSLSVFGIDLRNESGLNGGLIAFPVVKDHGLVLDLAKQKGFVVYAQCRNNGNAEQLRALALKEGLLSRTLYVEHRPDLLLPNAPRSVDLLVLDAIPESALTPEVRANWQSVLASRRGRAMTWSDGKLAPTALRGLPPKGADQWTHRNHGPDNNNLSNDSSLRAPFLTQWWALPLFESFWGGTAVSGGGRLFVIRGGRSGVRQVGITARSLGSGMILWQEDLNPPKGTTAIYTVRKDQRHAFYLSGRCCVAVDGDNLWMIDGDGIVQRNAETGEIVHRIVGPQPGGQIKWLALADGKLAVLAGDLDKQEYHIYENWSGNPHGRAIAVYDTASRERLWQAQAEDDLDEREIIIANGRLFYRASAKHVRSRDLGSGKLLWTQADPGVLNDIGGDRKAKGSFVNQRHLIAHDGVLLFGSNFSKQMVALAAQDGRFLWKTTFVDTGRGVKGYAAEGKWFGKKQTRDIHTGKVLPKVGVNVSDSCGRSVATPHICFGGFGTGVDRKTGEKLRAKDVKGPCDVGMMISDGIAFTPASTCKCNLEIRGYRAFTSAAGIDPHGVNPAQRLRTNGGTPSNPAPAKPGDWPTLRGDSSRSGAAPVDVGHIATMAWQWKGARPVPFAFSPAGRIGISSSAPEHHPTPAVAVGNLAWFGGADGIVRCIDTRDGTGKWKFATPGKLFMPPTYWQGRIFVGDCAGVVTCLDATSGKVLWAFDAAPAQRRILWYGHLINTWPIAGGVLVHNGVAYAVAGYQQDNGLHVYALDTATGKPIWETHDAGRGDGVDPESGFGSYGCMTVAQGRLWLSSATMIPGSFDLKDGSFMPIRRNKFLSLLRRGGSIGALSSNWVIYGGPRLSDTHEVWSAGDKGVGISAYPAGYNGKQGYAGVGLLGKSTLTPVWDAELTVFAKDGFSKLAGLRTDALMKQLDAAIAKPLPKKASRFNPVPVAYLVPTNRLGRIKRGAKPEFEEVWADLDVDAIALALAKDALVVAHAKIANRRKPAEDWHLSGFHRKTKKQLWQIKLPSQPIYDGICLTRHGRVLVSLRDGSVVCYTPLLK